MREPSALDGLFSPDEDYTMRLEAALQQAAAALAPFAAWVVVPWTATPDDEMPPPLTFEDYNAARLALAECRALLADATGEGRVEGQR